MTPSASLQPEELLAEYAWLQGLARSLVSDEHLAEDAVQETCIRALRTAPRDPSRMRQWLSSILRNFVRQQARSENARRGRESRVGGPAPDAESTPDLVHRVSLQQRVVAIVLDLDPTHRSVLLLRFFEGLPQREIARQLDVPIATVNSRLTRALQKVRGALDREFGGDRQAWRSALAPTAGLVPFSATTTFTAIGVFLMQTKLQIAAAALLVTGLVYFFWPQSDLANAELGADTSTGTAALTGSKTGIETSMTPLERQSLPGGTPVREGSDDPRPTLMAKGIVLLPSGQPAPDVAIGVEGSSSIPPVRSDASGRFEIELNKEGANLVCKDPDFVTVLRGVGSASRAFDTVLVVARPIELAGQVVSVKGRAISAVLIEIGLPDGFEARLAHVLDRSRQLNWQTKTADDGRFTLARVPGIDGLRLLATRSPFHAKVQHLTGQTDRRVYVVMGEDSADDGPAIVGRVIDPDDQPVASALIATGLTTTATDKNGNFRIILRRAGKPRSIRAIKTGFASASFTPDPDTSGALQWPDFIELRLTRDTLTIRGRVLDPAGEPVVGALVWTPDASPFGIHGLVPVSTEYLSAGGELPRRRPLPDKVVDAPLEGDENYSGMWHAKEPSAAWFYVRTDEDGRFTLPGLTDKNYRICAHDTKTTQRATTVPIAAGSAGIEVKMRRDDVHEFVAGTIVLPDGKPAPRVSLSVFCNVRDTDTRVPGGRFRGELIRHGRRTKTDENGRFRLDDTPAQGVRLSIYGDDIIPRFYKLDDDGDVTQLRIVVAPRYHLEVVLTTKDSADSIRGEDAEGKRSIFSRIRSGSMNQQWTMPLPGGRSGVLVVKESLRTIVFLKDGKEVGRQPVSLAYGEKCVVKY